MQKGQLKVQSRVDERRVAQSIDFSNVEFLSEADDVEDHDALVFLSEQANQNISDLLSVIGQRDHYVQSAIRALDLEIRQSFETLQKDYFQQLLKDTIKSLIQSARTYTTSGALSQARAILGRVQEWIEIYLKKKFDLLPEKAELGNSLAMLEARLGNTKLSIQLLEDTIQVQQQLGISTGVTLLNRCKVLSLMGRHEEASVAARSALGECSKNVVGEEKQKALVLCYFNIAVEEDYLKNHEVALLNYEKSYETSRDNLGEEDPLTQKVKLQLRTCQQQVAKLRESEMRHYNSFQKNKLQIKDRRLAAEDLKKQSLQVKSMAHLPKRSLVVKKETKQQLVRPQSASGGKFLIKEQKSVLKKPTLVTSTLQLTSPQKQQTVKFTDQAMEAQRPFSSAVPMIREQQAQYFDNSDAYQSDAPSRAVKGFKVPENQEIMSLTKLGVLKWEEDIDKNLESLDRKGSELGNEVVLKKAWEQDDLDEGEEDLQRRNQWAFLNQMKNFQAATPLVATTSQVRLKVISEQQEQIKVKQQKLAERQEEQKKEDAYSEEQFEKEEVGEVVVQVKDIEEDQKFNEVKKQDVKKQDAKKQEVKKPEAMKEIRIRSDSRSIAEGSVQGEQRSLLQQSFQQSMQQSQQQQQNRSDGITKLEDLTSGRPQTAKVGQKGKKKVERTLQERQHEWKERMLKEMEEYLLRYNEQQKSLFEGIQGNADKETTMIAINRKKREQVYGAQLGLEMLKERFAEQQRRLEEMEKHELHQQKVIEVLKIKRQKFQSEYDMQVKRFHAARVMLRYFQFAKDRRAFDNHKLLRTKHYSVVQEFKTIKLPQRMDLTKVNLRLQQAAKAMTSSTLISATGAKSTYQGKLKQTVSEIAFGTLAVYVDLRTHQLVFKFYAPPENLELERRRMAFYHQIELQQLEYFFGVFSDSKLTQDITMAVYALLKQTKMVVDYTKVGLSLSQVEWSRRDVMSDTLGDLTVVASRFVQVREVYSRIQCLDTIYNMHQTYSMEEPKAADLPAAHPWSPCSTRQFTTGRIFRDPEDDNNYYKILVFSEEGKHFGVLRVLGHVEHAFNSRNHWTMKCQLVNETVVPEMVKRDNELPLYFEVNLAKRVFRSRPKALREEEMVKLQRAIRKFLAWKRLKCMIENTYYMYLNKVFLYESEYKFWLRIYKKLQKQTCWVGLETLDLKVFMNEDQKRMQKTFQVPEQVAKALAKQEDPFLFVKN